MEQERIYHKNVCLANLVIGLDNNIYLCERSLDNIS